MRTRAFACLIVGLFMYAFSPAAAAQQELSVYATASVLTCGPGNDFYTTFGHTAIRITDPELGIDYVYNYGTFDFNTPNFYWKFMRGQLDYKLARTSFERFIEEYRFEGRAVWEQPLCFEYGQLQNLYILLETNLLPEYRYYKYDFFRDNCATRPRDVIYSAWAMDTLLQRQAPMRSYRRLVADNLRDTLEWWRLGIDLLFGLPADHRCTAPERMFLPMELMAEYAATGVSGIWAGPGLVDEPQLLLADSREPLGRSFPPEAAFGMLLAVLSLLTAVSRRSQGVGTALRVANRVLFVVAGLIGLFLCFMWFGTDHYCTAWNLNILWASPLLILVAIRMERSPHWALWLQLACFVAAAVWVAVCGLAPAVLLIIIILALPLGRLLVSRKGA
jgi:hypothetical protein